MDYHLVDKSNLEEALTIIEDAKQLLKKDSTQWQNGYPNKDVLLKDIESKTLHGLFDGKRLVAIMALKKGIEPTYLNINGHWNILPNENDIVVHRLAVSKDYLHQKCGLRMLEFALDYARECQAVSCKVDTHKNNMAMRKIIRDCQFDYCGIISLTPEGKEEDLRLAFEYDFEY